MDVSIKPSTMTLREAMAARGIYFEGDINMGIYYPNFQRFRDTTKTRQNKDVWVVVSTDGNAVTFGNNNMKPQEPMGTWFANGEYHFKSYEERLKNEEVRQHLAIEALKDKARKTKMGYQMAKAVLENAIEAPPDFPYLVKKGMDVEGILYDPLHHELIFPMIRTDGVLASIHRILPNGVKKYAYGLCPDGGMVQLSEKITPPIRVCEGVFTGLAIMEAVGGTVMCVISCVNLPKVVNDLSFEYPAYDIVICPDNDQWKAKGIDQRTGKRKKNTGMYYAQKAAEMDGLEIIAPDFTGFDVSTQPTDWYDLYVIAGVEEVRRQLLKKTPKAD